MGENETNLLKLVKECLSIVDSSTLKDKELNMLIEAAKKDLERVGVNVEEHLEDDLMKNTIVIYVKAHYGDGDMNKKIEYLKRYKSNLRELQFSEEYQKEAREEADNNA